MTPFWYWYLVGLTSFDLAKNKNSDLVPKKLTDVVLAELVQE